jgi:cytochrome c oxidase assembly factor CtaG
MRNWRARARPWLAVAGAAVILGMLLPPAGTYVRHYAFVESLQFVAFAIAGPGLLVLGAPWRVLRLSRRLSPDSGPARLADRVARSRSRRPGLRPAAAVLAVFVALVVAWRVPATVNALARNPVLAIPEMLTLVAAGSALWLELVESAPLLPRLGRPQRAAIAALAMWTVWILAYIMGLSNGTWFAAFSHPAGHGLTTAADQQIATVILWAVPALCFPPVIFATVMAWLRDSEDPDEALRTASAGDSASATPGSWPAPPRGWRAPSR